jgi:hypothetical protein
MVKMRAAWKVVLASLPLALVMGCAPPWTVIRQGNPNPINPQTQFAIDNTTFNNLMVARKSEAEYLADKKPETQQSFQNDKLAFLAGFTNGVQQQASPIAVAGPEALTGRFAIHSNVDYLEPGNFNGFVNIATEMHTKVVITDPNQQPVDEIELKCVVGADIYHPAIGMRVSECGRLTGNYVARYLKTRSGLQK